MSAPRPEALDPVASSDGRNLWRPLVLGAVPVHWLLTSLTLGLGAHHVVLGLILTALAIGGPRARRVLPALFFFWLGGVAYDYSILVSNTGSGVHVRELFEAELKWFAIDLGRGPEVAALALQRYSHALLDLVCGVAYIVYVVVPVVVAVVLSVRGSERGARLGLGFLLAMLLGIATYVLYPAAPPWYAAEYGLGPVASDVMPSPAGLVRFDALVGVPFFASWYSASAHVFGAVPSLHVAYPVLVVSATAALGWRWRLGTGAFAVLVAFSAVYLGHHYVIDVLAGLLCGLIADHMAKGALAWASRRQRERTRQEAVAAAAVRVERTQAARAARTSSPGMR
jgi:inositol phosphorylceramide synthase catalytic subunit